MEQSDLSNNVIKYLEGRMSVEEQQKLATWVKASDENAKLYVEIKDVWEASCVVASKVADTSKEWEKFKSRTKTSSSDISVHIKRTLRIWQSIAAVLVIMLTGLSLVVGLKMYYGNQAEYSVVQTIVPKGEKSQVVLPDGSKVWINSASTLSYNTGYGTTNRDIVIDGEAFFEVTHNEDIPFKVHTKDCDIKVLGTKFNVRSYGSNAQTETALLEGKVEVALLNGKQVNLNPGQLAFANNVKNELRVISKNVHNSICWKENVLRFDNTPLSEVIEKLSNWYGINIHVNNTKQLEKQRFTFTVKTESLNELLSIIKLVQPMKYNIKGEDVYVNIIEN